MKTTIFMRGPIAIPCEVLILIILYPRAINIFHLGNILRATVASHDTFFLVISCSL